MQSQPGRDLIELWNTKNFGPHHEDNVDIEILETKTDEGWAV